MVSSYLYNLSFSCYVCMPKLSTESYIDSFLYKIFLSNGVNILFSVISVLLVIVFILLTVAFLTLYERHILGQIQGRMGPAVVGLWGLLQPIADGAKLFLKETILPSAAAKLLFCLISFLAFVIAFFSFGSMMWSPQSFVAFLNIPILFLMALGGLSALTLLVAGWASNSKYSFLGALRSTAQLISYEISLSLLYVNIVMATYGHSDFLTLMEIQQTIWLIIPLSVTAILFFVCNLAEMNRHPFDLPEAEAELVGGYNTEYSAFPFAFFFLAEYAHMVLTSALFSMFFLGGWLVPFTNDKSLIIFGVKVVLVLYVIVWARAALPRYRYDQLMRLQWKTFLMGSLVWLGVIILSISIWGVFLNYKWNYLVDIYTWSYEPVMTFITVIVNAINHFIMLSALMTLEIKSYIYLNRIYFIQPLLLSIFILVRENWPKNWTWNNFRLRYKESLNNIDVLLKNGLAYCNMILQRIIAVILAFNNKIENYFVGIYYRIFQQNNLVLA